MFDQAIYDLRCPDNPNHGRVHSYDGGGYYCPHSDHPSARPPTQSFWTEAEWAKLKTTSVVTQEQPSDRIKRIRRASAQKRSRAR